MVTQRTLIQVQDENVVSLLNNFKKNGGEFSVQMACVWAVRAKNRIIGELKRRGHNVTGSLVRGFKVERVDEKEYIVTAPYYFKHFEQGTSPRGSTGRKNLPKLSSTIAWARKRGMTFEQFRSIVRKYGTKPHPILNDVFVKLRKEYERVIDSKLKLFIGTRAQQVYENN